MHARICMFLEGLDPFVQLDGVADLMQSYQPTEVRSYITLQLIHIRDSHRGAGHCCIFGPLNITL